MFQNCPTEIAMPNTLNTQPNLARPDDFYEALIDMHRDLDDAQSQAANAQLILLLANHIGDHDVLLAALAAAREGVTAMPATAPA
jgi:flagellar hook-basal body complex protein FliE